MSDIHTQILLIIRSISNDLHDLCSTSDIILYTLHHIVGRVQWVWAFVYNVQIAKSYTPCAEMNSTSSLKIEIGILWSSSDELQRRSASNIKVTWRIEAFFIITYFQYVVYVKT